MNLYEAGLKLEEWLKEPPELIGRTRDQELAYKKAIKDFRTALSAIRTSESLEEQVVDAIMSHYKGTEFPSGMAIVHSVRDIFTYADRSQPR